MLYETHTISIEHVSFDVGTLRKEGYVSDLALQAVRCNIQPTAQQTAELYQGAFGKVHTIYTTVSGILETDRVTVSGTGQKLIVKGKQYFSYEPEKHGEYICEEILD